MAEQFCASYYQALRKRMEEVSFPLLHNGCNTFDHYKHVSGIKVGLEEAYEIAQQVYKKLYEQEVLFKSGEAADESSRDDRGFY